MPNRAVNVPIWALPEPAERKPRFNRERIAEVAVQLADTEGFEAVSMRRIAAELGAGTMTLYHYVRTKEDLVTLMDDALMAELLFTTESAPKPWREALFAIAHKTRAMFVRHPWALFSMRGAFPGPNGMRHFEQSLSALRDAPFAPREKLELLGLVDDFVFGHALRSSETRAYPSKDPEANAAFRAFAERQLQTGMFPETEALFADSSAEAAEHEAAMLLRDDARFERGLNAILAGVQA